MDSAAASTYTESSVVSIVTLSATRTSATPVQRVELLGEKSGSALKSALAGRPAFIAISATTHELYGGAVRALVADLLEGDATVCVVPTGEHHKTLTTVEWLVAQVHAARLPRNGVIVGVGGGVLLDIVGLAASLFRRGVAHFKIGTTLVAQVDAAVGLKCGANSSESKNLVGAFYPPELVLTDGAFLRTLDARDVRCGIAEMIKLGIICDAKLFEAIVVNGDMLLQPESRNHPDSQAIIDRAIRGMVEQLNLNPYEADLLRLVDYGHTVSGEFEIATQHKLAHGEAVALDMALFAAVSVHLGFLELDDFETIIALLQRSGLDVWHPVMADPNLLRRAIESSTMHRGRRLNMPIPRGIGSCVFVEEEDELPLGILGESAETCREYQSRFDSRLLSERRLD